MAKLRANVALYEGLSAAYDFALDAEEAPEEYLRLVEAQGLKIQLRSPMKPVVKLAFDGMCDDVTIKQLEAVLAWAFEEELPRGSLAERIEAPAGLADPERGREGRLSAPPVSLGGFGASLRALRRAASPSTTASTAHLRDRSARMAMSTSPAWRASQWVRLAMLRNSLIAVSGSCCWSCSSRSNTASDKRLFEFQADEFLAVPDDAAELRLEPGDAEPDPAVVLDGRRAFDAAAVGRHVDHPRTWTRLRVPSRIVAFRRSAVRSARRRSGLLCGCLSHGIVTPWPLVSPNGEQMVPLRRKGRKGDFRPPFLAPVSGPGRGRSAVPSCARAAHNSAGPH